MTTERKRPLRTYGRQSQRDACSEPPAKKLKVADASCAQLTRSASGADQPDLPPLPPAQPAQRGSILAFFKPLSSSSRVASSDVSLDPPEPSSSPPSSPPVVARPRTIRRLTTRLNLDAKGGISGSQTILDSKQQREATDGTDVDDVEKPVLSPRRTERMLVRNRPAAVTGERRIVLREVKMSVLNAEKVADSSGEVIKAKARARWRSRRAGVQTTLNLSMSNDPGFTICKDCEMLYNPLNEKDRKDHARRHTASRRKREGQEIVALA